MILWNLPLDKLGKELNLSMLVYKEVILFVQLYFFWLTFFYLLSNLFGKCWYTELSGDFKTQLPVDWQFRSVLGGCYCLEQQKPAGTGRNHWSTGGWVWSRPLKYNNNDKNTS